MRNCTWLVVAVASITAAGGARVSAAEPPVQALEWNVFLGDWQLLGPFPKDAADATGLDTKFVPDEAGLRGGQVSFYKNKLYAWKPHDERVVQFRKAFKVQGPAGDNVVAYAWTQFTSPVARKAVLAVGYDDMFAAWVNGKEVGRGTANWASSLDQERREVELRAGVNTLLLKVGNGVRAWDAAARFRPAGLDEPLLTFRCQPGGDISRLPTVGVVLLDSRGETISEHRCSGGRKSWPGVSGHYALYAALPDPPPSAVRFVVREPGLRELDRTLPWGRVQSGKVALALAADRPLELFVVDQGTRQPIAAAEVWTGQVKEPAVSDAQGRITLPEFSPMANQCWVAARGYAARRMNVAWPRGKRQRVELFPGGRTVTGTVRSTAGQPLAGATVKSGLAGYAPQSVTGEDGRFELFGLPEATDHIYPTLTCPGFIARDSFSFSLGDGPVTDVVWELEPGATVAGRVTHRQTGAPLAGVTVTVGDDRFGGDTENPSAKTNADGRYELTGVPPGPVLLHAFSENHAPAMRPLTARVGETVEAGFQLDDGEPVTGVVTDPAGVPLVGVWLVTDTWNGARMFRREAHTDGAGRFTLPHMPDTAAEVHVLKNGFISNRNFQPRGGDTVKLELRPVVIHTIRVRDAEKGQIVPDLQIAKGYLWEGREDWSWNSETWETDRYYDKPTGVFKLEIDEAFDYKIAYRFRAAGYQQEVVTIPRDTDTGKQFEVRLKPATAFEGRVVDASTGAALPGVTVAMVSSEDRLQSYFVDFVEPKNLLEQHRFTGLRAVTDPQGRFRLSTPTTKAVTDLVLIGAHGGFHFVTDVDRVLRSEELRSETLELSFPAAGSVEGRVVVADKPVANAPVHLQWLGHDGTTERGENFGIGGQVVTDADGRFRFPGLGPGRYRLNRVFTTSHGDGSSTSTYLRNEDVVLLPGATLVHDLVTPAGLSVAGVVRDTAGKPVGAAVVTATTAGEDPQRVAATRSDDQGRFVLEHLARGTYTLSAEHYARLPEGYFTQDLQGTATVEVTESRDDVSIEVTSVNSGRAEPRQMLRGTLAPEFAVTPVGAAKPFTLSEHFGRVVVVSFWGPWSGDLAGLRETFARYKDHEDVAFLTVFHQDEAQFRDFQKKQPVEFPVTTTGTDGNPVATRFGVWGNAMSFVIGRDGRFAAERLVGGQLAAAVEAAVSQPLDPALADAAPLRVHVTLAADGGERGVPGARVALKAVDASGRTIRADQLSLTGKPREVVWHCPAVAQGGKVTVTVSGRGFKEQTRTQDLKAPSAVADLRFVVPSPRKITGRVLTVDDGMPVAGMRVRIQSGNGEAASTRTDADGRFAWPCFPGPHYLTALGNARHAVASDGRRSVDVRESVDPAPVEWKASPAVTVQGVVVDKAGQPVAGARVLTLTESQTTTDAAGRFTLEGVAAVGTTQVYALSGDVYGAVHLRDPQAEETCRITLGQGLDEPGRDQATPLGGPVPPFDAQTLDGEPTRWQPAAAKDRLLVLCALWHPESRAFVEKAERWAAEHGTQVELVSLDWSLDQARRELKSADFSGPVLYAGPGSLRLGPSWPLSPQGAGRTALLVKSDGTLAATPLEPSAP